MRSALSNGYEQSLQIKTTGMPGVSNNAVEQGKINSILKGQRNHKRVAKMLSGNKHNYKIDVYVKGDVTNSLRGIGNKAITSVGVINVDTRQNIGTVEINVVISGAIKNLMHGSNNSSEIYIGVVDLKYKGISIDQVKIKVNVNGKSRALTGSTTYIDDGSGNTIKVIIGTVCHRCTR